VIAVERADVGDAKADHLQMIPVVLNAEPVPYPIARRSVPGSAGRRVPASISSTPARRSATQALPEAVSPADPSTIWDPRAIRAGASDRTIG
jgi:hypothetical protein